MWRASAARSLALLLIVGAFIGVASPVAASLVDPRLRFRVLSTAHFVIYFHQGEEVQAVRLSAIAEEAWHRVSSALGVAAPRRTHVILADQAEVANGWASPLPRNTIFVTAAAPGGADFIGRSDDWMRLVFTHEFTHIVHLDRSEGWARVFRGLFGRIPVAFPNLSLPEWQIEGLAAFEESAETGEGRLHAGDFRMIEREAARVGRLEPLDRVNGGLTDWPGGLAVYAYGLGFHEYLAGRFGTATLGELAGKTARRVPYLSSPAFRAVYGESLGSLWKDYRAHLAEAAAREPLPRISADAATSATQITRHGHVVVGPRFLPVGAGVAEEIVYSVQNPESFPALRSIAVDGSQSRRLADRYLGSTVGAGVNVIVLDQQEWRRNVGLYSDLYALDRHTGKLQALTRESRIQDPDLSPDGRTIVGVREQRGRRELVLLPLLRSGEDQLPRSQNRQTVSSGSLPGSVSGSGSGSGRSSRWIVGAVTTLISASETQFNAPRWSPDGLSIVVARQPLGALSEIIVVNVADGTVRTIASDRSARFVTPTWRPDGRAIVAAVDYDERPFDLYEFPVERPASAGRRLTALAGGARWPEVSPDGRTIVFVGYTVEGFDLFTIPYPRTTATEELPSAGRDVQRTEPAGTSVAPATTSGRTYSPLPTLAPTSWSPIVETGSNQFRAGITIGSSDVLVRHAYAASATWLVSGPSGSANQIEMAPDWQLGYAYSRWRPTFFLSASRDTAFGAGPPDAAGRPTAAVLRSTDVESGFIFPVRRARISHRLVASMLHETDRYTFADHLESDARTAARAGWATNTAHTFGYSISQERGLSVGSTAEFAGFGSDENATATTVTADVRTYLAGLASHHVLALRVAAGLSDGNGNGPRVFHLGGPGPSENLLDFGRQAMSLLRGFPTDSFAGTRVAVANADYRFPIARPQRGLGTLPLMVHTLHAAVFADAGHAWTRDFAWHDVKLAAGGELAADVVAAYSLPLTIAVGAAWGHDGADGSGGGTIYLRVGHAF